MEREVAPVTLHDRVEIPPGATEEGEAVKLAITGAPGAATVTVAVAVTVPDALEAERV
jgi:hypothetical protein